MFLVCSLVYRLGVLCIVTRRPLTAALLCSVCTDHLDLFFFFFFFRNNKWMIRDSKKDYIG